MTRDAEILALLAETLDVNATLIKLDLAPGALRAALRAGAAALGPGPTPAASCPHLAPAPARPAAGSGGELVVHTDGASRGNPGPAGAGYALYREGKLVEAAGQYLGRQTNNQAEYNALILALARALELGADRVVVRTDSELLARQLNGTYRVKNPKLIPLFDKVKELARRFGRFRIEHVYREDNLKADQMANRAIDEFEKEEP